jgi:hypothetical protein
VCPSSRGGDLRRGKKTFWGRWFFKEKHATLIYVEKTRQILKLGMEEVHSSFRERMERMLLRSMFKAFVDAGQSLHGNRWWHEHVFMMSKLQHGISSSFCSPQQCPDSL